MSLSFSSRKLASHSPDQTNLTSLRVNLVKWILIDSQLVISRSQLYLRENLNTLQLIKQIIYSWEWILILHHHLFN